MTFSIILGVTPANDNAARCEGCGERRDVRDGLCAHCNAEISAMIDAHARHYAGDVEGEALLAGHDVSDSLRFID